jgi:hypothetical protein
MRMENNKLLVKAYNQRKSVYMSNELSGVVSQQSGDSNIHSFALSNRHLKVSKLSGHKAKGRPRMRWIDNIKDILKKHGYSTAMATHLALGHKLKLKPLRFAVSGDQN